MRFDAKYFFLVALLAGGCANSNGQIDSSAVADDTATDTNDTAIDDTSDGAEYEVEGLAAIEDADLVIDGAKECSGLICLVPEVGLYTASLAATGWLVAERSVDVKAATKNVADLTSVGQIPVIDAQYSGSLGTYNVETWKDSGVVWVDLGGGFSAVEVINYLEFSGVDEWGWTLYGYYDLDLGTIWYHQESEDGSQIREDTLE